MVVSPLSPGRKRASRAPPCPDRAYPEPAGPGTWTCGSASSSTHSPPPGRTRGVARRGTPPGRGDALPAARLAAAAAQAATALVRINLAGAPDDPRPARASHLAARAARLAAQAASHAGDAVRAGN